MEESALIKQVSRFPVLFKKSHHLYKYELKKAAWNTIGNILGRNYITCKRRWNALRAKYMKLRRNLKAKPSGSAACVISWPHFEAMRFLEPYLTTRHLSTEPSTSAAARRQSEDVTETSHTMSQMLEDDTYHKSKAFCPSPTPLPMTTHKTLTIKSIARAEREVESDDSSQLQSPSEELEFMSHTMSMKEKRAQEELFEKLGYCLETFSKIIEAPKVEVDGNLAFCQSLAKDMNIFTREEQIILKGKIYSVLLEMLRARN